MKLHVNSADISTNGESTFLTVVPNVQLFDAVIDEIDLEAKRVTLVLETDGKRTEFAAKNPAFTTNRKNRTIETVAQIVSITVSDVKRSYGQTDSLLTCIAGM